MIEVENLSKRFGQVVAVEDLTFRVDEGEILGFLGPNGAGKSTTLRMLVGLVTPSAGRALVGGHDVAKESVAARRLIGHLPEGTPLYHDMKVTAFLRFVAEAKGLSRDEREDAVRRSIDECGLDEVRGRLIRHLSKGFRQRVGLAQAVLGDPPVLVLDEPTVGLDPRQIIEIRELIRRWAGRRTVILSTHILPEVEEVCDRVVIISRGRKRAEGTPGRLASEGSAAAGIAADLHAPAEDVRGALRAIPEATDAEVRSVDETTTRVRLEGSDASSIRRALVRVAAERGWEIVQLGSAGSGLEETFLAAIAEEEGDR